MRMVVGNYPFNLYPRIAGNDHVTVAVIHGSGGGNGGGNGGEGTNSAVSHYFFVSKTCYFLHSVFVKKRLINYLL